MNENEFWEGAARSVTPVFLEEETVEEEASDYDETAEE